MPPNGKGMRLMATHLKPLEPTPDTSLTLVTCYPFYFVGKAPQRFVVRGREIDGGREPVPPERGDVAAPASRPAEARPAETLHSGASAN